MDILTSVRWYFIVVLIGVSLIIEYLIVEYGFLCLLAVVCLLWRNVCLVSGEESFWVSKETAMFVSPVQDFVRWQELLFSPSDTSVEWCFLGTCFSPSDTSMEWCFLETWSLPGTLPRLNDAQNIPFHCSFHAGCSTTRREVLYLQSQLQGCAMRTIVQGPVLDERASSLV